MNEVYDIMGQQIVEGDIIAYASDRQCLKIGIVLGMNVTGKRYPEIKLKIIGLDHWALSRPDRKLKPSKPSYLESTGHVVLLNPVGVPDQFLNVLGDAKVEYDER